MLAFECLLVFACACIGAHIIFVKNLYPPCHICRGKRAFELSRSKWHEACAALIEGAMLMQAVYRPDLIPKVQVFSSHDRLIWFFHCTLFSFLFRSNCRQIVIKKSVLENRAKAIDDAVSREIAAIKEQLASAPLQPAVAPTSGAQLAQNPTSEARITTLSTQVKTPLPVPTGSANMAIQPAVDSQEVAHKEVQAILQEKELIAIKIKELEERLAKNSSGSSKTD